MKKINVLSLFDGISGARVALERAKIPVRRYMASEIEECSISVTMKHFPDTECLGDVRKINVKKLPKIDLIVGGSPCQSLSGARTDLKTTYKVMAVLNAQVLTMKTKFYT